MKKYIRRVGFVILSAGVLYILFLATVLFLTPIKYSESQPLTETASGPAKEPITADGLYLAINQVRSQNNLPQFKRNAELDKSSSLKCESMVKGNYYDHKDPVTGKSGGTYAKDVGVRYAHISENLNNGSFQNPNAVIDSWMGSEAHKASILDPQYTEIGFSVCVNPADPAGVTTVVQHKINPAPPVQSAPQRRAVNCSSTTIDSGYSDRTYTRCY